MSIKKNIVAASAIAATLGYSLPVSAQIVYYTQPSSIYQATPVYSSQVITQPVVLPQNTYVDSRVNTNPLGRAIGGGALGAGLGALGGLIYGSVTRERLGRSVLGGTAAGAAIGAGASLLGGLLAPRVEPRTVASPGYGWY